MSENCPLCGGELQYGFGLAGGGYGPYTYCDNEGCSYFDKVQEPDEQDVAPKPLRA